MLAAGKAIKLQQSAMAVKFSPHSPDVIAYASSENFGLVGNSLVYFESPEGQSITQVPNAVFDIAFSESSPDLIATAGGDGFVRVDRINPVRQG